MSNTNYFDLLSKLVDRIRSQVHSHIDTSKVVYRLHEVKINHFKAFVYYESDLEEIERDVYEDSSAYYTLTFNLIIIDNVLSIEIEVKSMRLVTYEKFGKTRTEPRLVTSPLRFKINIPVNENIGNEFGAKVSSMMTLMNNVEPVEQ